MPVLKNTLAFFYALLIYLIVVVFVFFKIYTYKDRAIKYTDMKNTYIDLELGDSVPSPVIKTQEPNINQLFNQKSIKKHVSSKLDIVAKKDEKESNLGELFSNLDYKEKKSTKVQAAYKSNIKTSNLAQDIAKKLDNLKENTAIVGQNKKESKAGVYDPFLGALRRILEQRWRLYNSSGEFKAMVYFTIDTDGYFYYEKVIPSGDKAFDDKLYNFLSNIKGKYITLPPHQKPYFGILELSDKIK